VPDNVGLPPTETGTEQADERNEEFVEVEELKMVEPSSEGDPSTGIEAENNGPRMLSLGTGKEQSQVVWKRI
jgi:hypothetical protein